ncbi:hypothetical protein Tco_0839805 [Tanacetum coccineum]|uniref:Uncharacterized protein n=1 Tax=Tanacetum coccineum TaxID=301880 RepID=A0ABQ5AVS5_9ASTR
MSTEALQAREDLMRSIENFLKKFNRISFRETPKVLMQAWDKLLEIKHAQSEDVQDLINKLVEDVQKINEDLADYVNCPGFNRELVSSYDDDDGEYSLATQEYLKTYSTEITPEEPVESLSMGDEHLDTIPATESDEVIKSSVEILVPTPSDSEDFSDLESECDMSDCDNFTTFSNPLFDDNDSNTSNDEEEFKISSNPLYDLDEVSPINEEVLEKTNSIPPGIEISCFNSESDLLESLLNRDSSNDSSQKIDSLLDEFAGELTSLQSIPPGIDNINFDSEGDILFLETLLYDNSSPRPPKAVQTNYDEINLFTGSEDSIPPGIENDDFDSEDDDNSALFPEFKSFHVDYPKSGNSTNDVVEDIPVDVPNLFPTHPDLLSDFDFIHSHNDLGSDLDGSSPSGVRNKIYDPGICIQVKSMRILTTLSPVIDKVFNHDVLASKEKSTPSSSHRDLKASKLFHHENPLLIHGDNTPSLSVCHPHFYPP